MISVVLIEDQALMRQGLRSLLQLTPDIAVVGEAADGERGLQVVAETQPDVVLLDLRMPRLDGLATLRAMGEPRPAVLVLTTFDDDEAVVPALQAGAQGYLLKDVTLEHLVAAIRTVAQGGTMVQPGITDTLLRRVGATQPNGAWVDLFEPLTPRDVEILRLVVGGHANREIAAALYLTEGTVKKYVSRILDKLGVRDRTRAALRGLELGIVQHPH